MPRLSPTEDILARSLSPEDGMDDIPASIPPTQTKVDDAAEEQLEQELVRTTEHKSIKMAKGSRKQKVAKVKEPEEPKEPVNGSNGDEEIYEVESVVDHRFQGKKCLYRVRWAGYDEDQDTWEPDTNLLPESAAVLAAYHKKVGGTPQPPKKVQKSASKANLKEESALEDEDAEPPAKRSKRTHTAISNNMTPDSKEWKAEPVTGWTPAEKGSWEDLVHVVETVERDDEGNLYAFIRFKNGKRSKVAQNIYTSRCPRAMLRFYEDHLNFATTDPMGGYDNTGEDFEVEETIPNS